MGQADRMLVAITGSSYAVLGLPAPPLTGTLPFTVAMDKVEIRG